MQQSANAVLLLPDLPQLTLQSTALFSDFAIFTGILNDFFPLLLVGSLKSSAELAEFAKLTVQYKGKAFFPSSFS